MTSVTFVTRCTDLSLWQKAKISLSRDHWGFAFKSFLIQRQFLAPLKDACHACRVITEVRSESDPKNEWQHIQRRVYKEQLRARHWKCSVPNDQKNSGVNGICILPSSVLRLMTELCGPALPCTSTCSPWSLLVCLVQCVEFLSKGLHCNQKLIQHVLKTSSGWWWGRCK